MINYETALFTLNNGGTVSIEQISHKTGMRLNDFASSNNMSIVVDNVKDDEYITFVELPTFFDDSGKERLMPEHTLDLPF